MELHRSWKAYLTGPIMLALGVLCAFSPWLLRLVDRQFALGDWIGYAMAAIFFVVGVALVRKLQQPFLVRIDGNGITRTRAGTTARFPWRDIIRVADLSEVKEPRTGIDAALRQYAGVRYADGP